jgi:hypothetical protein
MHRKFRPVRLAYQPPANSTFLSEQNSHQQYFSLRINQHQPPAKRTGCLSLSVVLIHAKKIISVFQSQVLAAAIS